MTMNIFRVLFGILFSSSCVPNKNDMHIFQFSSILCTLYLIVQQTMLVFDFPLPIVRKQRKSASPFQRVKVTQNPLFHCVCKCYPTPTSDKQDSQCATTQPVRASLVSRAPADVASPFYIICQWHASWPDATNHRMPIIESITDFNAPFRTNSRLNQHFWQSFGSADKVD